VEPYSLNKSWRISADKHCYILERLVGKTKKEWRPYGFYTTVGQTLTGFIHGFPRFTDESLPSGIKVATGMARDAVEAMEAWEESLTVRTL